MVSFLNIITALVVASSSFIHNVEAFSNLPHRHMVVCRTQQEQNWMTTSSAEHDLSTTTPKRNFPKNDDENHPFVLNLKKIAATSTLTFLLAHGSPIMTPNPANAVTEVPLPPEATTIVTSSPDVTFSPLFGGGGFGISPFGLHPFGGFGFGVRISSKPQAIQAKEQELQRLKQQQQHLENQIKSFEEEERKSQLSQGKGISHKLTNTLNRLEESNKANDSKNADPMEVGASAIRGGLPFKAVNAIGRLQE